MEKPWKLIGIAFILLVIGVVLPFLMVIGKLESTWLLNFIAFACSTSGLIIGFIGIAQYVRSRR